MKSELRHGPRTFPGELRGDHRRLRAQSEGSSEVTTDSQQFRCDHRHLGLRI